MGSKLNRQKLKKFKNCIRENFKKCNKNADRCKKNISFGVHFRKHVRKFEFIWEEKNFKKIKNKFNNYMRLCYLIS